MLSWGKYPQDLTIAERHRYILDQLEGKGFAKVSDLSEALGVSVVTIRKDLKELESRGLLYRSHGSASSRELYAKDRSVSEKESFFAEEKRRIGKAAAAILKAQEAIIIGSGTTGLALARSLPHNLPLTVLTAAMNVSLALLEHDKIEVVQLGGILRKSSASVVGPYAEEMMRSFACTRLFLGVDGISPDFGLTTSNAMEAHLNRQMMQAAEQTIVLTDASKFGRKGFGKICDLEDVDLVITDQATPAELVAEMEERGVEVRVV